MAEEDNSVNVKVDENKTPKIDGKTNGEKEEKVDTKSPVKQSPVKQSPVKRPSKEQKPEEFKTIQSPKKQKKAEVNKETVEEQDEDESSSDEELPLGSLEGPVQIMEGKRERKKVDRLTLEKKETPEKKKFEIVEGQGTKLGEMERVEMILGKTNADQLKLLYRFLFGKVGKLFEIKKHIRQFSGFNFTEDDSDYDKKEQVLIRITMTALRDFCSYLDLERGGNKDVVMKRILDFCLNPVASGKKIQKKKKAQKRKRLSGKEKSEKTPKKPKKEKPAKVSTETVDDDDISDISSISSISSDSEDEEEKKPEKTKSKPEKTPKKVDSESEEEAMDEEDKSPKKKVVKETQKKPSTPKKKEKVEKKKPKEEKKKVLKKSETTKKSETPKKSESPKKAKKAKKKDYVVSSDSDSSDSEPILKKKKAPSDSELKTTIETLLENANLEEITMKAFCKQVYAQYPDFDLKHKKEYIKTTVKTIVS